MSKLKDLGNNSGLLYATDKSGLVFLINGTKNNDAGAEAIKRDALTRAGEGYPISAQGAVEFSVVGANDSITDFTINGVSQFNTVGGFIPITLGMESDAAQDLVDAVNSYIPPSGANYTGFAIGGKAYFNAPSDFGSTLNGDVLAIVVGLPASQTIVLTDVDGGSDGDEVISEVNGRRYFINSDSAAVPGDLTGATEITDEIVMRGSQNAVATLSQTIASASVTNLDRYSNISVLELGAGGATDLDVIKGDFAIHDIIIIKNTSAFTITVNDLSINSGNLKLSPTTFAQINDDYLMLLMYIDDPIDGLVFKELFRTPQGVAVDSITDVELAPLSVGTPELKALSVTAAQIALTTITQAQMALLSIGTPELIDGSVTNPKIGALAVDTAELALLAVDTAQLKDDAITTAKILDSNVTLEKLEADLQKGFFTMSISWDSTTEIGQIKAKIPFDLTVDEILVSVADTIEATDDATFIPKNNAGTAMTDGTVDVPSGTVIGNDFTSTPTANNTFVAGEKMIFETLKGTPGGRAEVTVCYTRN